MLKPIKLLVFLLFIPLVFHAQKTLTGLWTGTLSNDSTTIRKNQSFEIALTEYRGKVYGYSRMTFFVNDTLYYIVKRVKGNVEGELCEVKDDNIITHNFPRHPDKGVKLISTFRRSLQDSIWRLDGDWKTTESKKHRYYSISGKISLSSEPDISKSKIFPHLEELDLAKDVAFYNESKKKTEESIAKTNNNPSSSASNAIATTKKEDKKPVDKGIAKTETQKSSRGSAATTATQALKDKNDNTSVSEIKKQDEVTKKNEQAPISEAEEPVAFTGVKKSTLPASNLPAEQKKDITGNLSKPEVKNQEKFPKTNETVPIAEEKAAFTGVKKSTLPASNLPSEQKKDVANNLSKPETKNHGAAVKVNEVIPVVNEPKEETIKRDPATLAKSTEVPKVIPNETLKTEIKISSAAAFVQERKTVAPQILEFKSDSLELKLYDNGEIDGDTVSILLNGEILLARQGLKASAIRKTIYIQPGNDEITLVLYAENLGRYPPNTGLVVISDGEDDYQVRFSADLQQNAAITLRRKK